MIRAKAWLLTTCLFMIICMGMEKAPAVEMKETNGVQLKWVRESLEKHLLSIETVKNEVKITSDGQYRKPGESSLSFFLKRGEKLESSDHHSRVSAVYVGTAGKSVRFSYEVRFDSRSFGKDQISVDRGEVTLETRTSSTPKPPPSK